MKEITCIASNSLALFADGKLEPSAEIALVLSEVEYRIVPDGQVVRERAAQTVRFASSPAGLRKLAEKLLQTADDTERDFEKGQAAMVGEVIEGMKNTP